MISLVLYKKAENRNVKELSNQLCLASGINPQSAHRPHGFSSIVSFNFGDVYIDNDIHLRINNKLNEEIENCLERIKVDDFGSVSQDEKEMNIENKYFGCGKYLVGRYEISIGVIELNVLSEKTQITLLNEKG